MFKGLFALVVSFFLYQPIFGGEGQNSISKKSSHKIEQKASLARWEEVCEKGDSFSVEESATDRFHRAVLFIEGIREEKRDFEAGESILLDLGEKGMAQAYAVLAKAKISLEDHLDFEGAARLLEKAAALGHWPSNWFLREYPH